MKEKSRNRKKETKTPGFIKIAETCLEASGWRHRVIGLYIENKPAVDIF
jgi:hypothetical protein